METNIKVGDILCGTWGYSMTIPCFFKVIAMTDKRLKVVELPKQMVNCTDGGYNQQGYEMPVNVDTIRLTSKQSQLARQSKYDSNRFVVGSNYDARYLRLWDGKPIWADYMD